MMTKLDALQMIVLAMNEVFLNGGLPEADEEANEEAPQSFKELVMQNTKYTEVTEKDIDVMLNTKLNDFYKDIINNSNVNQIRGDIRMDDFITVVFKCSKDSDLRKQVSTAFKDDSLFNDAQITAVSLKDEISRVEQLEEELNRV